MGWLDTISVAGEGIGIRLALSSGNPYLMGASAAWLVGDFIYNYLTQDTPPPPKPADNISLPVTAEGTPMPLIYGRVRVKGGVLMFSGPAFAYDGASLGATASQFVYEIPLSFCLGVTYPEAVCKIFNVWYGDTLLDDTGASSPSISQGLQSLTGGGGYEKPGFVGLFGRSGIGDQRLIGGYVELMNGHSTTHWIQPDGISPNCHGADEMILNGTPGGGIPDYVGKLCVSLSNAGGTTPKVVLGGGFFIGVSPNIQPLSFEVQAIPAPHLNTYAPSDSDMNPIDVLQDLLIGDIGKLGVNFGKLDYVSFNYARQVLKDEGNGYARVLDSGQPATDVVNEICAQTDAMLYEDPSNGVYYIKLIRPDYVFLDCPVVDPSNCVSISQFSTSSWLDLPNQVRVLFTNRAGLKYGQGSAVAQSQGNAAAQGYELREISVQFPGICEQPNADSVAYRELLSRNKPLMKCIAYVQRLPQFLALRPGSVVRFSWPEANISEIPMRVVNLTRGTPQDGKIQLNLVQDYYNQWRRFNPDEIGDIVTGVVHADEIYHP